MRPVVKFDHLFISSPRAHQVDRFLLSSPPSLLLSVLSFFTVPPSLWSRNSLNPARRSGEAPVHFSFKMWYLVATILMIFLRSNLTNFVQTQQNTCPLCQVTNREYAWIACGRCTLVQIAYSSLQPAAYTQRSPVTSSVPVTNRRGPHRRPAGWIIEIWAEFTEV